MRGDDEYMIIRQWHIAGSVLVLAFQLGGCGLINDLSNPAASKPMASKPAEKSEEPLPPRRHPSPPSTKLAKVPSPDDLIGLDETGVRKLLGVPTVTRNDNAARIFSYHHSIGCTLDVIFFMDMKAGDLRVLSYQWNGGGAKPREPTKCYAELQVTS